MKKEKYWSKFAENFEVKNDYVVGSEEMSIFLNKVKQQKKLGETLELGCGNGTYSRVLANEVSCLVATDFSDEMVNFASYKLKDYKNIKVEKADCSNLSYPEQSFNTIFMANLLHIIPEPEKAIAECKRVLKKGGRLIILSLTTEGMGLINKMSMIYRYLKTYGKPSPFAQILTVAKTEIMLKQYGFMIKESKVIGHKMKAIFVNAHY